MGLIKSKNMLKSKKGSFNAKSLQVAIIGIVLIVVIIEMYAVLIPQVQTSGNTLNATGAPLTNLFTADGVVPLVLVAGLVIVVIAAALGAFKSKK